MILLIVLLLMCSSVFMEGHECSQACDHGRCLEGTCVCDPGWKGPSCQWCEGRLRLHSNSSVIIDGLGNYTTDSNCAWLIDVGQPKTSIRLYLDQFATECSWDHLYVYDGDSIYDPLLAVFSGMVVQDDYHVTHVPEVVAKSGHALLYFSSDAAYGLMGFSLSYRVDGCPSSRNGTECSGRGECLNGLCTCDDGWEGSACSVPVCPSGCSGNGQCDCEQHKCLCHLGYTGPDCSQATEKGWWEVAGHDFTSQLTFPEPSTSTLLERSSHSTVVVNNTLWVLGGYSFTKKPFLITYNITKDEWSTLESTSIRQPTPRHGHSTVLYNGSIYMYGGMEGMKENSSITQELWQLDTDTIEWFLLPSEGGTKTDPERSQQNSHSGRREERVANDSNHKESQGDDINSEVDNVEKGFSSLERGSGSCYSTWGPCAPIPCVGHAAVVVQKVTRQVMLVIFGYSSTYGYLNTVQEYDLEEGNWSTVETGGAVVGGMYGHTAIWDPYTSLVFVHGGLLSTSSATSVVPNLMTYNPIEQMWKLMSPAPVPRYLHSAVLVQGLMLVFGGNTYNDTDISRGAKCYSADFLAYDITCDAWHTLQKPPNMYLDVARYGHSGVLHQGHMYIVGGFDSKMLGSVLRYHPGNCEAHEASSEDCLRVFPGRKCVWNKISNRCESHDDIADKRPYDMCPAVTVKQNFTALCLEQQQSCLSCVFNTYDCIWCGDTCTHNKCLENTKGIVHGNNCEDNLRSRCKSFHTCHLCQAHDHCDWINNQCTASPNRTASRTNVGDSDLESNAPDKTTTSIPLIDQPDQFSVNIDTHDTLSSQQLCQTTCSQKSSCSDCTATQGSCLWIDQQRCVDSNSYLVSCLYGQCREWTTQTSRCMDVKPGMSRCSIHQTCQKCQGDVACGWCDDGSGTGTGTCLEGGQRGPIDPVTGVAQKNKCPSPRWFFTDCPICNCNGHSWCENGSQCIQPCASNTSGSHCQHCMDTFFGSPINGGLCEPCKCNGQSDTCNQKTGRCFCYTKGIIGDHCERCDIRNNYIGDPLKNSCFYDLTTDYQFTFNLSKPEDLHVRQINFMSGPRKSDLDTDFFIQTSKTTTIKISAKTNGQEEWIIRNFTGLQLEERFNAYDYAFGSAENSTTFRVYVSSFTSPIEIIVSFSQHPKLEWNPFSSLFSFL